MITPRPYQEQDAQFFAKIRKGLLLYKPRVGKTVTTVRWMQLTNVKKAIIVSPLNAFATWKEHLTEMLGPDIHVAYAWGTPAIRSWAYENALGAFKFGKPAFVITTYASYIRDRKYLDEYYPDTQVFDEAGKRLTNKGTKNFNMAKHMSGRVRQQLILSGTLIDRHAGQLWAPMHLTDPQAFKSYWRWVQQFCEVEHNGFGQEIIGNKNIPLLHNILRRYAIGRKRDVTTCPPRTNREWKVQLTTEQKSLYKQLDTSKMAFTAKGNAIFASTSLETQLRLRQLLCCPKLLDPHLGVGGALEAVVEDLEDMPREDQHVVIFTQFRKAFPFFREYLYNAGFKNVYQLNGGISPEEQSDQISKFRSTRGIMLCTVDYAEAFSLAPATLAYMIGFSWSPSTNEQAGDRLVPQDGTTPIEIRYCIHEGTVEEALAQVVVNKHYNATEALNIGSPQPGSIPVSE